MFANSGMFTNIQYKYTHIIYAWKNKMPERKALHSLKKDFKSIWGIEVKVFASSSEYFNYKSCHSLKQIYSIIFRTYKIPRLSTVTHILKSGDTCSDWRFVPFVKKVCRGWPVITFHHWKKEEKNTFYNLNAVLLTPLIWVMIPIALHWPVHEMETNWMFWNFQLIEHEIFKSTLWWGVLSFSTKEHDIKWCIKILVIHSPDNTNSDLNISLYSQINWKKITVAHHFPEFTCMYPPEETSILLSGEKQRSVTQPPCADCPFNEAQEQRWSSSPLKTFQTWNISNIDL